MGCTFVGEPEARRRRQREQARTPSDPWLDGAKISDILGDSWGDLKEDSREARAP
jgi:hypothetical protein